MGQSAGKERSKVKAVVVPGRKYAALLAYWIGESDDYSPPSAVAPVFVPSATGSSGDQFLALLSNRDLRGLVSSVLDQQSLLSLRLSCRAAALHVEAMRKGVLDLRFFPVLLQGLKLACCTAPWPVTELVVDQMVLRVPGGLEGLEKVLREHSQTIVRLEVYAGPGWRSIEVRSLLCFCPCVCDVFSQTPIQAADGVWELNAVARKRCARLQRVLALPFPRLRHLVMGWEGIGALDKIAGTLPSGQLETCVRQGWATYVAPTVFESADAVRGAESVTSLTLKCGPAGLVTAAHVSRVLSCCPMASAVRLVIDPACDVSVDELVACVARATNRRLRDFSVYPSVGGDAVHITYEGVKQLVASCPLLEVLSLHMAVRLTEASMRLMHARWLHTLRYLDVSGSHDANFVRLGEQWCRAPGLHSVRWFFFDEGFSD